MDGAGASSGTLAALTTEPPTIPSVSSSSRTDPTTLCPPEQPAHVEGETLLCLIIKGFSLLCRTGWMEPVLLRGSRRRNREESDQKGEIHREAYSVSW